MCDTLENLVFPFEVFHGVSYISETSWNTHIHCLYTQVHTQITCAPVCVRETSGKFQSHICFLMQFEVLKLFWILKLCLLNNVTVFFSFCHIWSETLSCSIAHFCSSCVNHASNLQETDRIQGDTCYT